MKWGFLNLKKEIDKILIAKEKDIIKKTDNQITQGKNKSRIFNRNLNNARKKGKINYPPKRCNIRFINSETSYKRYHRVLRSDVNFATRSINKLNFFKIDTNGENKQNQTKTSKKNKKNDNIKSNFNDYELNNMSYSEVIIFDKRSCFEYYISLIKTKHPFFFWFLLY